MQRRICFVTGTRAEYGLMRSTMRAIADHPRLRLQLIATGMHLDRRRGHTLDQIRSDGWPVDAVVRWPDTSGAQSGTAQATGAATSQLARAFEKLGSDIVMVVGDRVEAFASTAAAHISGRLVAHIHGGDRALGLVDDSLRHAITKLAHVHFPATKQSAKRVLRLGEDHWRIFQTGSPGIDDIQKAAASSATLSDEFPGLIKRRYALLLLHPETANDQVEARVARSLRHAVNRSGIEQIVIIHPNNDPGSRGIARVWDSLKQDSNLFVRHNVSRPLFLGLLRDAALLAGNSSSGIIEAATFGTPVLDIGDRQKGRERGANVCHCSTSQGSIARAISRIWKNGSPPRYACENIYGHGNTGLRIASVLARISLDRFRRKLIAY